MLLPRNLKCAAIMDQ